MAATTHPRHRTSTANLQAIYPGIATSGLPCDAVYIGRDIFGGSFCYDPWELYRKGVLHNPNLMILGSIGNGKSAFVKSYVLRQLVFGRQAVMLDPKGENGPLCEAVGTHEIKLEKGGRYCLNPLDSRGGPPGRSAKQINGERADVVAAILGTQMGRKVRPVERIALQGAIGDAIDHAGADGQPTLAGVAEALFHPSQGMADFVQMELEELRVSIREIAYELRRLIDGDLGGMFDGPTSSEIDLTAPVVSFNLRALFDSEALGILMVCVAAWLQQLLRRRDGVKRILVLDEAWAVLKKLEIARWLQQSFKLCRDSGVQNIVIVHRLSDLNSAGDAGSEQEKLARGLLSDAGTVVIYNQPPDEMAMACSWLHLNEAEAEQVGLLNKGEALWRVAGRPFIVQHVLSALERPITDTDSSMRDNRREFGESDAPVAAALGVAPS